MLHRLSNPVARLYIGLLRAAAFLVVCLLTGCGNRPLPVLRVGCEHIAPYCVFTSNERPTGLMADVLSEAAARRGLSLKWIRGLDNADEALNRNVVDIWPALGYSPVREKKISITKPWLDDEMVLLSVGSSSPREARKTSGNRSSTSGVPDLIHASFPAAAHLAETFFPRASRIQRPSKQAVVEALCGGEAKAALVNRAYLDSMLLNRPASCQQVRFTVNPFENSSFPMGIASTKQQAALAESLFHGIEEMAGDGTLERIMSKWRPFSGAQTYAALRLGSARSHNRRLRVLSLVLSVLVCGLLLQLWRIRNIERRMRLDSRALAQQLTQRQAAEERFRALFDQGSEPRLILDTNGLIVDCNLAAMALRRATDKSELIGQNPYTFAPELQPDGRKSLDIVTESYALALRRGSYRFEWWRFDREGTLFPAEITLVPIQLNGNALFLSSLHDLSQSKRTEEALRRAQATLEQRVEERTRELQLLNQTLALEVAERTAAVESLKQRREELRKSERQYRFLAESIPQILFTATPDGVADYYNQHFARYTGLDISSLQNADWKKCIHPDEIEGCIRAWLKSVKTGLPYEYEHRMLSAAGTYRWFLARAIPMCDTEGKAMKWFGTCTDIDDRKEAERLMKVHQLHLEAEVAHRTVQLVDQTRRAEQASRAKSEFLARMSHEIRTPMNSMLGVSDLLWESELSPEQRDLVRLFCQNGNRLLNIVNDILDLSKVESGTLELNNDPFSLRDVVFEVAELLSTGARKRNLKFDVEFDASLPSTVIGDQLRIRQVLTNLLGNALKFTEAGGVRLSVTAISTMDTKFARFSVTDTGPGIPESAQRSIFEPFNQGDTSVTRKHGGTGLGLAISKRFVEQMGGEINLVSRVGEGSTFWFTVPCSQVSEERVSGLSPLAVATPPADTMLLNRNARILVVDDSPENILLMRMFLQREKVDLDTATNGQDAIQMILSGRYDLVFMDVRMPVMDGRTATRATRTAEKQQGLTSTPILALSADALPEEIIHSLDAGCNEHLTKPIRKSRVLEAIRTWVYRQQPTEAEPLPV